MNGKYLLFTIISANLLLYLFSFAFYRSGMISRMVHRQVWNWVLLLSFFFTAAIGTLAAIKANYHLNIPFFDRLLRFHVETGIVLFVTGIIHIGWHVKYFTSMFKPVQNKPHSSLMADDLKAPYKIHHIRVLLFLLGAVTTCSQIIFLREYLNVFSGNELVVGILFFFWMALTGLGSYTARSAPTSDAIKKVPLLFVILIIFPLVFVVSAYNLPPLFVVRGEQASLTFVMFFSLVALFIPCFVAGYLFNVLSAALSAKQNKLGRAYSIDATGSVFGGALINIFLLLYFNSLHFAMILMVTGFFVIWFVFRRTRWARFGVMVSTAMLALSFFPATIKTVMKQHYKPYNLINTKSIPSGNIDITTYDNQINLFHNSVLLYHSQNIAGVEEDVHYAMMLHNNPKQVLVISGGYLGMLKEIDKYKSIENIDFIEPDRWLSRVVGQWVHDSAAGPKVNRIFSDVRKYLVNCDKQYDVVLVNCPMPFNIYFNRFYTYEFFKLLHHVTGPSSVVSVKMTAGANYLSENERKVLGLVYNSLNKVFNHVGVVPGSHYYFMASARTLQISYQKYFEEMEFQNEYVNPYYIDDINISGRSHTLLEELAQIEGTNHDLLPRAFLFQIKTFMEYNNLSFKVFGSILFIISLIFYIRFNPVRRNLFVTGLTAMSAEISIIVAVQIYLGSAFYISGLVITLFMACIALGARYSERLSGFSARNAIFTGMLVLALVYLAMALGLGFIGTLYTYHFLFYLACALIVFLTGFFTGAIYTWSSSLVRHDIKTTVAHNYSADLSGSAIGALAASVVFIPMLGMVYTCLLLSALTAVSALVNRIIS